MIIFLQYLALAICAASAVARARAAWRGRGVPLFVCFSMMTVATALSISPIYNAVDPRLGGIHLTNLILRVVLLAVFFMLGKIIAQAFDSMHVEWLISGRPGIWAMGFTMGVTAAAWVLGAYQGGAYPTEELPGLIYSNTWRFYLAYVAVCLLVMLLPVAFDIRRSDLYRWSAILQSVGFAMVFVVPFATVAVLMGGGDYYFVTQLSMGSIIFVASGLMLVWVASWRRARRAREVYAINA